MSSPKPAKTNASERYLHRLAKRCFLSPWSHPRAYKQKGEELCDLLVVFGNHVLIFSDKDRKFPNTGDPKIDWERWYNKSIYSAAKQLGTATRWLRNHPKGTIYSDPACTVPLDIILPPPDKIILHRILVAHGASARCRDYFHGGTGSLAQTSAEIGDSHPFRVGALPEAEGLVHVLDDVNLDLLLDTLDTASDLIDYLTKKEKLFMRGSRRTPTGVVPRAVLSSGEENMIAEYLLRGRNFNVPDSVDLIVVAEDVWDVLVRSGKYDSRKRANDVSYLWDAVIERFAEGESIWGNENPQHREHLLRKAASPNRVQRRLLAESVLHTRNHPTLFTARILRPLEENHPHYCFISMSPDEGQSYSAYRQARLAALEIYCLTLKERCPDAKSVIGFATDKAGSGGHSEELVYYDLDKAPPLEIQKASRAADKIGIMRDVRFVNTRSYEFTGSMEVLAPKIFTYKGTEWLCSPEGDGWVGIARNPARILRSATWSALKTAIKSS